MRRVSLLGVGAGGIIDIVATNVVSFPVLVYAAIKVDLTRLPQEQQVAALVDYMQSHSYLFIISMILGSLSSVLGGYVAALIARHDDALNGALAAFLGVTFGLVSLGSNENTLPVWVHIAFVPFSLALGALGGVIRRAQRERKSLQAAAGGAGSNAGER